MCAQGSLSFLPHGKMPSAQPQSPASKKKKERKSPHSATSTHTHIPVEIGHQCEWRRKAEHGRLLNKHGRGALTHREQFAGTQRPTPPQPLQILLQVHAAQTNRSPSLVFASLSVSRSVSQCLSASVPRCLRVSTWFSSKHVMPSRASNSLLHSRTHHHVRVLGALVRGRSRSCPYEFTYVD
jgi:hypothetical protein